jgi:hypothetical protein
MELPRLAVPQRSRAHDHRLRRPLPFDGKIFINFYIFVGMGIILAFIDTVAERAMERARRRP